MQHDIAHTTQHAAHSTPHTAAHTIQRVVPLSSPLTSALAVHCVLTPVPFAHMPLLVHATQPAVAETTSLSDVGFEFVY